VEGLTLELLVSALSEALTAYDEAQTDIDPQILEDMLAQLNYISEGIYAIFYVLALIFASVILFFVFKTLYNFFSGIFKG
jgi:hypothetical protein